MIRAAWKTKKIVASEKEDIKVQAQPEKQASKEPQPTEKPREQKGFGSPYNQIYGR